MKAIKFKISVIALAIGMFAVSCGGGGSKQQSETTGTKTEKAATNDAVVQFVSAEGYMVSDNEMRVQVEFDKAVSGIFASDFTSSAGKVNMVQCSSGNTMYWTVYVTGLNSSSQVTLSIQKKGYNFNPSSKTVTVE